MMEGRLRFGNPMTDPLQPPFHAFPQDVVQIPPHRVLPAENIT
jgi:hypothetical protein